MTSSVLNDKIEQLTDEAQVYVSYVIRYAYRLSINRGLLTLIQEHRLTCV